MLQDLSTQAHRTENLLAAPQTNRDTQDRPHDRRHGPKTVTAAEKAQAREVSLRRIGRLFAPYKWQLTVVTAIIAASSLVGVTEHGADVMAAIRAARGNDAERLFGRLSPADRADLARILTQLREPT